MNENNIDSIAVDYFGGGQPEYYLGNKVYRWSVNHGQPVGWFAISATFKQQSLGENFDWLQSATPVARAGQSIFIYRF